MRMIGFGASQVSMGGAAVALPLDAASVIVNPAGISELNHRIDFGGSFFKPTVKYQAAEALPPGFPAGSVVGSTAELSSQRGASPVPALGMVLPINDQLWFGLGAYGVAGMGVDYAQNLYGGLTYSSYQQMRFAPGLSWKVNEQLSLGATANVMWGQMGYDVASGFGQVAHNASSAFGLGATLGARYSPVSWLTVGAAYESKSTFQDFSLQVPAHTEQTATGPVQAPAGVDKLTFNQPQAATIGFAAKPSKSLVLAFDVQWINWAQTNGQNLPEFSQQSGAQPWNLDWDNQVVYKVGVQYNVIPMLALRAGYNYGKSPLKADRAFENIAFPAIAEHHITGGFGLNMSDKFGMNFAVMYAPETTLSGSNANPQLIASYRTSMSQLAFDANVAYQF
ncbi:MAG: OmpP1/FadL family transporter [Anaeromyxobacteraceae bacterium]